MIKSTEDHECQSQLTQEGLVGWFMVHKIGLLSYWRKHLS